ncbi:type IX secretion system sortase PorU [Psychroserpens mesophilus]|uniref:type IX secretion system sortase PorU n=1 Tax=Psychroserpens mesophilus TaxID=325473 RepID=UPI003D6627C3
MKKLLLISFIVCTIFGFAQQKQFTIQWDGTTTLETSSFQVELPAFNKKNYSYSDSEGLFYISQWEISSLLNEKSLTLSNVSYATISVNELKGLSKELIPNSPNAKLSNSVDRDKINAFLKISPIINDDGILKKITSFTINYSSGSSNRNAFNSQEIVNSVLNSGSWRRFYVENSGVFKITKRFLEDIGVNTDVDPRTIKIYGNGGAMLPMPNDEFYPIDLTENAIKFIGENDGVFNDGDYILFYAEGPKGNVEENRINTNINPYTNISNYYVNFGGSFGKRIETAVQPDENPDFTIDTFQDYQFYEVDEFNIAKLGRRWFGDRFDVENEKTVTFNFPNLVTTEPAKLKVYVAAVSDVQTFMDIKVNSVDVATISASGLTDGILATGASYAGDIQLATSEVSVNLEYNNNGNPSSLGYLDYVSIEAIRDLIYNGGQLRFKNDIVETTNGIAEYVISNASNVNEVWDITDKYNVTSIPNSNQDSSFNFKAVSGNLRHYIALNNQNFFEPSRDGDSYVSNQNLKGTIFLNSQGVFQDVDYIIVTPSNMLSQAERLADINRQQYDLSVKVVTLDQIYKEFSSGNQDIGGIRNFVRYVYHNASAPDKRLKYLCLFGDASFDYKNRISNNTNIVPTWFSYNSFSLTTSFVSDDFYAMMDDNEGNMEVSNKADIAVGRILANTPQQATELVDKIQEYYSELSFGSWRNNILMISDDVDVGSFEGELQQTTDNIANIVTQEKPFLNAVKIHSDAFLQESSSAGERYPQVNKEIRDAIDVGALVVNYFGHGGEDGLASERIFDKNDSQEVANACKYNLFITVTCEYTKFDDPLRQTAGEFTYWNAKGGAIGLITTTRQIFVSLGQAFNVIIEPYLFAFGSNEYPSVAEALRLSKNDPGISGNIQKPLVWFIGDPAMKLAFAKPDVRLTKINDIPIGGNTDVLQALGKVKLSGEVVNESGNVLSDYNGILTATVFDKEIDRQTLNNDNQTNNGQPVIMDFKTLGEIIFKGQATVANGQFEFEFVVPRDIGIPVGPGKVSFYTMRKLPLENRAGSSFDIQVGGINENAAEDNTGPVINLFMNDENFVSGGITNEQPSLLAKLQDENGINTASGIGHDIVAIIDGDETNPFVLNDYYQANIDDYQNGKVSYPFRDLEPGLHTLSLKAWDVYNNSSTAEIQFVVYDKDQELVIDNVLNYPNPFIDYTEFWFNHNSPDVLDVSVQIFTVSGKLVRTLNGQTNAGSKVTSSLSKDIVWDGRDDFGDKIGKGVYIYKLKVRSNRLNKQVEKIEKLVIL